MPSPPSSSIIAAVSPTVPGSGPPSPVVRPVTYTVAPAAPSSSAMPLPMPRLAPVTTAILPTSGPGSERIGIVLHGLGNGMAVEHRRVLPRDLANVLGRKVPDLVADRLLGV